MSREINEIIVHCSATPPSMDIGADTIREWHTDKGWIDIGYHFVIRRNGVVETGRDLDVAGAHAKGHNSRSIGICLIGGVKESDRKTPDANFTFSQYESLAMLIGELRGKIQSIAKVSGHRDYAAKACPCFDVNALLDSA